MQAEAPQVSDARNMAFRTRAAVIHNPYPDIPILICYLPSSCDVEATTSPQPSLPFSLQ